MCVTSDNILNKLKKLPKILNKINTAIPIASLPQVLLKLVEVCKDETQTAKDIARIASLDPAFSLKLLQLSMIGETEKRNLGNLEQAVIKLGPKTIKNLAVNISVNPVQVNTVKFAKGFIVSVTGFFYQRYNVSRF